MLLIYQIIQSLLLAATAVFITDSAAARVKYSPLPPFAPRLIQIFYLLLTIGYLHSLFSITELIWTDWLALALNFLGAFIIIKGVLDKKESERQPGFDPKGLYRRMRHPIYTGLTLFVTGLTLIITMHAEVWIGIVSALLVGAILVYLYANAQKEELHLKQKHGQSFIIYRQTTYAVWPINSRPHHSEPDF